MSSIACNGTERNVSTTVGVKIHSLIIKKTDLLAREYEAFQTAVHGGDADLYPATGQQASKVQRQKCMNPGTQEPVVLRNDVFDVSHDEDTVLSSWWVTVPVYDPEQAGKLHLAPAHVSYKDYQLVREGDIRDSELVRRGGDWYIHLVVKRSVTVQDESDDVLAIDMGRHGSPPARSSPTAKPPSTARKCVVSANTASSCGSPSGKRNRDKGSRSWDASVIRKRGK
ncbi:MAG: hypothetical protein J07HQW2_01448 [Haloquadratum walsbyi J07HQW2]|uniref:Uncharacterized protein n=1 Tax=Haloquadratum walsbyi J07HQW2 TaxID=1238425 RepID=U1MX29_9EURY|nr:MAG: hypothetical protein J07HQW2_01448 [Haloquadratum walsbyi J07HQW2]